MRWGATAVHWFERVGSTNDVARHFRAPGVVVLAEEQTAGRGRLGREWISPARMGLWFSVTGPPTDLPTLPLRIGLAIARGLDDLVPGVGIKWPNDLYLGDRKLGGILCEATWEGDRADQVVAGVGINVLQTARDFPPEIRSRATSLRMAGVQEPTVPMVADAVIPAVLEVMRSGDLDLAAFAEKDILRGRSVVVEDPMTGRILAQGLANGVRRDGSLMIGADTVRSGTVTIRNS